jgi:hypothetical protein
MSSSSWRSFPPKLCKHFPSPHVFFMPNSCLPLWLGHSNYIQQTVQVM